MKKQKKSSAKILSAMMLFVLSAALTALAQNQTSWKIGDKVEVENIYTQKWEQATISEVKDWGADNIYYKAKLDNPTPNSESELLLRPNQIRTRAVATASAKTTNSTIQNENPDKTSTKNNNPDGSIKVGDRVVEFDPQNRNYIYRATVLEVADGRYRIQRDGCTKYEMWIDKSNLRPAQNLSPDNADVRFLIGKWSTQTVATVDAGVAWGNRINYLQINSDGTYVWQYDKGTPVKGKWRGEPQLSEAPKKASDSLKKSEDFNGIIIKNADGSEWKVYKYIIPGKAKDSVVIERICGSAASIIGTRM